MRYKLQPLDTPEAQSTVLGSGPGGESENYSIAGIADYIANNVNGVLQNNTIRQFNTIKATGSGLAAAVVAFNGSLYLNVSDSELINVKVNRGEIRQEGTKTEQLFYFDYYWLKSGKGTYGLNGAMIIDAGDLLYRGTNEVISIETIDNLSPVVYDAFALDVESDSIASYVNARVSPFLIDANADYFFILIEVLSLITDEGVTGNYKYYRFIGADGNYGFGQDQAVNGDFIELAQNDIDLQTQASLLGLPDVHESTYAGKHGYVWEAYENNETEPATSGSRLVKTLSANKNVVTIPDINSDYAMLSTDGVINCTDGDNNGTFGVALVTAVGYLQPVTVKNSGTGTITVQTNGSETIDGASTKAIATTESITLQSDGANWIITGKFNG
jgi:hypothetical protein